MKKKFAELTKHEQGHFLLDAKQEADRIMAARVGRDEEFGREVLKHLTQRLTPTPVPTEQDTDQGTEKGIFG